MASVNSRNQLGYVQLESAYGTIPNASGVASVANANAFRMSALSMNPEQAIIVRPDKNSSLSPTLGTGGRKSATWNMRCSLAGNGAAGAAPDIGPFLQALMGKAPVISAGVSVTYGVDDTQYSLAIYNFWKPSTASQQVALGSIVQTGRFSLGGDVAEIDLSGQSRWVLDTDQFSTADVTAKGGLTAFPAEPSAPVTNGTQAVGFTGLVTLDGNTYGTLRTANVTINANRDLPNDVYNNYYGVEPGQDVREVLCDLNIYDDDSANLSSLKVKGINKTPVTLSFQVGTNAGNKWTFTMNNVLLGTPQTDDGGRRKAITFNGCRAHATSSTSKDEIVLVLT